MLLLGILLITSCYGDDNSTNISHDHDHDGDEHCDDYKKIARLTSTILDERGTVCCEDLGCYSNDERTPWEHLAMLPNCMRDIWPEYFLFTPENDTEQTFNYFTVNDTVGSLRINRKRPFFVIIHGYNTEWSNNFMFPIKKELIRLGNNVMLVKWTGGSNNISYFKAAANTRTVGKALSIVVQKMVDQTLVDLSITTIIGFSLGAHTAGYAGSNLPNLRRIIGLDPAGPLFVCEDVNARLDPGDAKFVQVFHTNGLSFLSGGLGTLQPLGHVDFYVNGGKIQPGCLPPIDTALSDNFSFSMVNIEELVSCSHTRCPLLFLDMLRKIDAVPQNTASCSFNAFPCDEYQIWKRGDCFACPSNGCPLPGYILDIDTPYHGKFFFSTHTDNSTDGSYCGKQYRLTLVANKDVKGEIFVSFYPSDSDISDKFMFQKSSSKMQKDIPKSAIIVAPWETSTVRIITVNYKKHKSIFFTDGPSKFILTNVTISDQFGVKVTSCSEVEVETEKPSTVKFAPGSWSFEYLWPSLLSSCYLFSNGSLSRSVRTGTSPTLIKENDLNRMFELTDPHSEQVPMVHRHSFYIEQNITCRESYKWPS